MYIVLEGIDTAGKSTQLELLTKKYTNAIFTKEPGGTEFGLRVRSMILDEGVSSFEAELYLFLADRAEHYTKVIKPNLDKTIISDRSLVSGISYAYAHGGYSEEFLLQANKIAMQNQMPTHIIILKLSKEELLNRLSKKSHDKIEQRGVEYLLKIQEEMITIAHKLDTNVIIIDASQSIEKIHNTIIEAIK
jgi:dTMP kinase